jgi:hypothetical protein
MHEGKMPKVFLLPIILGYLLIKVLVALSLTHVMFLNPAPRQRKRRK